MFFITPLMTQIEKNPIGEKKEWPVRPTFISLVAGKKESEASLNNEGVFYTDMLKGFLANASTDVETESPMALYQIVPKGLEFDDPKNDIKIINSTDSYFESILTDNKIILIHSDKFRENKKCCLCFRKLIGEEKCFSLDSRIALLYDSRLSKIHFDKEFNRYLQTFQTIVDEYNRHNNKRYKNSSRYELHIKPIISKNRLYVHYTCPHSKFEEYFFPIVAAGQVVAVLMSGQRISKDTKREEIFKDYIEYDEIVQAVNEIPEKEFNGEPMPVQAIANRIGLLESRISERIQSAGKAFVSRTFLRIENSFREEISTLDYQKTDSLKIFKTALNNALCTICHDFDNQGGFIRIFGTKSVMNNDTKRVTCQLIGGSSNSNNDYSFHIPQKNITNNTHWHKDQILQYANPKVKDDIDDADDLSIMNTNPFIAKMPYILWKSDKTWDKEYKTGNYMSYREMLQSFYHTLLEPYAILKGILANETLEKSVRISGHESAQMLTTILDIIKYEFTKKNSFKFDDKSSLNLLQKKMRDVESMLDLLDGVFQRPAMIFKEASSEKDWEWFDFYRLLVSMNTFFDEKAKKDNKQQIKREWNPELNKYRLYTNRIFINHIMYNLIENAIKYGYRGSNIHVNAKYKQNEITISVISFGIEIPESDWEDIFELFYRPDYLPEVKGVEGMGIGMFVARSLCRLLGYTISCTSRKYSDTHIPMCYHFYKQINYRSLLDFLSPEERRLLRSIPAEKTDEVVNKNINEKEEKNKNNLWKFGYFEIDDLIQKATYKNKFTVKIPIKDNFLKYNK